MTTEPMTQPMAHEAEPALVFRPWRGAPDTEPMAGLANAANRAEGVDQHVDAEGLLNFYSHDDEQMVAERDLVLVEQDGTLVAYGWTYWADTTDGLREHRLGGYVHPDWTHQGIGTRLLHWLEERARQSAAEVRTERPHVYGSWADEQRVGKQVLLQRNGYEPVRWFFDMRRDELDQVEVPPMPDGLEVRVTDGERSSLRKLFEADAEAFQDHWGGFPATDATFETWIGEPYFDHSLFVVAWDGDEIAGAVINAISRKENEAFGRRRGWLESVFVRRPWRRRGLAAALVARSLVVLRERGMDHAMLGVDADNPTSALGVYQRAGFRVVKRSTAYRKPMEPAS